MSEFEDDIFNIQPSKNMKADKSKKPIKNLTKSMASDNELSELGELDEGDDESADIDEFTDSIDKLLSEAGFDSIETPGDEDDEDDGEDEDEDSDEVIDVSPTSESKFKESSPKMFDPAKAALNAAMPWFQGYALQVHNNKTKQTELIQTDTAYQALALFMQKSTDQDLYCQIFALFPVGVNVDLEPDFRATNSHLTPRDDLGEIEIMSDSDEETISPELSDNQNTTFVQEEQAIADTQVIRPGSPFQADV